MHKRTNYCRPLRVEALEDRRLLAAGDPDLTFDGDGKLTTNRFFDATDRNEEGRSVAVQSDGKIVVVGSTWNGADYDFAVARYNTDGSLDTSFGGDGKVSTAIGAGDDKAYALVIQTDGKIVVAGSSHNGFNLDVALVRYLSNGNLDTTFNGTGKATAIIMSLDDEAYAVGLQSNGTIVVAGTAFDGATDDFFVTRFSSNGTKVSGSTWLADSFTGATDRNDQAYSLVVNSDNTVVVTGFTFSNVSNSYDFAVAKFTASGFLDDSFDGDGKAVANFSGTSLDEAYGVAIQTDGRIVVAGRSQATPGGPWTFAVARFQANGTLNTSFDGDGMLTTDFGAGDDEAYSVVLQPGDGKIFVGGKSNGDFALARYNPTDGALDTTFSGDGKATTSFGTNEDKGLDIALQSDGKIVAAGYSTVATGNCDFAVARFIGPNPPEVTMLGNTINIVDGATTIGTADGTDYGSVAQNAATVSHTFTIRNDGGMTLTLSGLTVPSGYTVTNGLATSLAPGATDTIVVRLNTTTVGVKSGQVSFTTNDSDENPFTFAISGAVTPPSLGDYNQDTLVDAGDYVFWRKTFGQSDVAPFSGADGSGNGSIGQEDYGVWRSRFGTTFGAGAGTESGAEGRAERGEGEPLSVKSLELEAGTISVATVENVLDEATFGASAQPNYGTRVILSGVGPASVGERMLRDDALLAWLRLCDSGVLNGGRESAGAFGRDATSMDASDDSCEALDLVFEGIAVILW